MGNKIRVRLTEQELSNLIVKSILGDKGSDFLKILQQNTSDPEALKQFEKDVESKVSSTNKIDSSGEFNPLDLTTQEGFNAYEEIADKFISTKSSNLLGITGNMLATGAKNAQNKFGKYVPVELALAQLAAEGGFSKNPNARPIKTKNPFNVGNTDSGANEFHSSVQSGIQRYYDLIAKNYLVDGKTASDLLRNFVNKNGHRYATSKYEGLVSQIASQVKTMASPVYAKVKTTPDISLT